jgi:hypothetical protein
VRARPAGFSPAAPLKSHFLALAALAALAAIVVGSLDWTRTNAGSETAMPANRAVASRGASKEEPVPLVRPEALEVEEPRVSLAFPEPSEGAAPKLPDDPIRTVELLTIDHATGLPIAGAKVSFATDAELAADARVYPQSRDADIEDRLQTLGRTDQSDEHGLCRIPIPPSRATVIARYGRLFGRTLWDEGSETVRIELCEDVRLWIRTIDGAGAPQAGFPVELCSRSDDSVVWSGRTGGPHAEVAIPHANSLCLERGRSRAFFARLAIPSSRPAEVAVSDTPWPFEPVTLTIPRCGAIQVHCVGDGGQPFDAPVRIQLFLLPQLADAPNTARWRAISERGLAQFERVEVACTWRAQIWVPGRRPFEQILQGPTSAGEQVHVTVECGPAPSYLTGRLVDGAGAPLANTRFQSTFSSASSQGGASSTGSLNTDSAGRFRCLVRVPWSAPGSREWRISGGNARSPGVTIDLARELPPGDTDLGDITVQSP